MMNDVARNLEVHGVEVENNEGKQMVDAEAGSFSVRGSASKIGTYGNSSCQQIEKYGGDFAATIPIIISDAEGEIYGTDEEVPAVPKYFTFLNTDDGVYALKIRAKGDYSELDSAFSDRAVCETPNQEFGILGSMYDDTWTQTGDDEEDDPFDY